MQAGGLDLDLDLDVFGSLSVTLEDLPNDGTSASVDDSSDHINLPVCRRTVEMCIDDHSVDLLRFAVTCMYIWRL